MPAIDAVVTWDEQARTGLLLAVNRDANTPHTLTIDLSGLPGLPGLGTLALSKAQLLHEDDPYRTNTAESAHSGRQTRRRSRSLSPDFASHAPML